MTTRWAISLPPDARTAAARLRLVPGVTIHETPEGIWLQGDRPDEAIDRVLRSLPGARRFTVLRDGSLLPYGHRVPHGALPPGDWHPIADWLSISLPTPSLAGRLEAKVPLRLVRSTEQGEASLLVTALGHWRDYVEDAPQVRLGRWRFAIADDGRALVRGTPLPSLPGERFVDTAGIATPAGWTWSPAVDAADVARLLDLAPGDLALCHWDGSWEHVPAAEFVRATRSAARLSAREAVP